MWVHTRLCKLQKGCTRLAAASNKVDQLLPHGRWVSPGTPASATTKTGHHDIAEILLKVALSTINQIIELNCVCTVVSNTYCVVFFLPSCVPYVTKFFGLSFFIAPPVLSNVHSLMKSSLFSVDIYMHLRHRYTEDTCQRFLLKIRN